MLWGPAARKRGGASFCHLPTLAYGTLRSVPGSGNRDCFCRQATKPRIKVTALSDFLMWTAAIVYNDPYDFGTSALAPQAISEVSGPRAARRNGCFGCGRPAAAQPRRLQREDSNRQGTSELSLQSPARLVLRAPHRAKRWGARSFASGGVVEFGSACGLASVRPVARRNGGASLRAPHRIARDVSKGWCYVHRTAPHWARFPMLIDPARPNLADRFGP
jgi:hypothetical protein